MALTKLVGIILCSGIGLVIGQPIGVVLGMLLMMPIGKAMGWELESLMVIPVVATIVTIASVIAGAYVGFVYIH